MTVIGSSQQKGIQMRTWLRNFLTKKTTAWGIIVIITLYVALRADILGVFKNTIPAGYDITGHFLSLWWLSHYLLPHGQIAGWFPGEFSGVPLFNYYFVFPFFIAAVLGYVLPLAVAFKIIILVPVLTLPTTVYLSARIVKKSPLESALIGAMSVFFLLNTTVASTFGGSLYSGMLGEFTYGWSLNFLLLAIALTLRSINKKRMSLGAVVFWALAVLSHVIPVLIGSIGLALVLLVIGATQLTSNKYIPTAKYWRLIKRLAISAVLAGLLAAFWLVPLEGYTAYSASRQFLNLNAQYYFLITQWEYSRFLLLAIIGTIVAIRKRSIFDIWLLAIGMISAVEYLYTPTPFAISPMRGLPTWSLAVFLLAGKGLYEVGRWAYYLAADLSFIEKKAKEVFAVVLIMTPFVASLFYVAPWNQVKITPQAVWAGINKAPGSGQFNQIVATMVRASKTYGCGNFLVENPALALPRRNDPQELDEYGSDFSLSLMSYYTNDCIGSEYGLLYESSPAAFYLALAQQRLGANNGLGADLGYPLVGINYKIGFKELSLLADKYYMTYANGVHSGTNYLEHSRNWRLIDKIGNVDIFLNLKYSLATPITSGIYAHSGHGYFVRWYENVSHDEPIPVTNWTGSTSPILNAGKDKITRIHYGANQISFFVSQLNTPVYVRVPYFPAWTSTDSSVYQGGANQMVVVPHGHYVVINYAHTKIEGLGEFLSIFGIFVYLIFVGYRIYKRKTRKKM
jgi:hypothetical protein